MGWDVWDAALVCVAGYVAVTALVKLMHHRRDAVIDDLSRRAEAERQRKKLRQRREEHQRVRAKFRKSRDERKQAP